MHLTLLLKIAEAALISSPRPLSVNDLQIVLGNEISSSEVEIVLSNLKKQWLGRGVQLVEVVSGWRFQTTPDMSCYLDRLSTDKPLKYTKATLETLAIIAYRQPVTRGDIEDLRGVTNNAQILRQLEDRGWVEVVGHREAVGRPALFATTRRFLDELGLISLEKLPEIGLRLAEN